jgi:hypothetical protein
MGDKVGRIHMKRQDFNSLGGGRRVAALRNGGSKRKRETEVEDFVDGKAAKKVQSAQNGGRNNKKRRQA